jgi:hypothetical protein
VIREYLGVVAPETDLAELVGRDPDPRLFDRHLSQLPESIGPPPGLPSASRLRRRLVGAGAAMTGLTLVVGVALGVLGLVLAGSGGLGLGSLMIVSVGLLLVATHWGWVHVAEASADALEGRAHRDAETVRLGWLARIEPYTRFSIRTQAHDDGSIELLTLCHRPVPGAAGTFTFAVETVATETHSGEEPAATVAERAELLRRRAAAATQLEHERYEVVADAYQRSQLELADEQGRRAAARAASEALSEQINTHLREPPLLE